MTLEVDLELSLLEAEAAYVDQLIAERIIPVGARREPTERELRAGVKFAELDRLVLDAAGLMLRKVDEVRGFVLDGLATQLAPLLNDADPWAAVELLDRLATATNGEQLEGLEALVARVAAELEADLVATAEASADEAIAEGQRQGIPEHLVDAPVMTEARRAAQAHAARVAVAPVGRLLEAAAYAAANAAPGASSGAAVLEAALDGAEQASTKGVDDVARQAANVAHGAGRAAGQVALPRPAEVYASELLDSNTCSPCAELDGRTYESLEAGLVDYPGAGGYVGCDGGSRCRGTLVLVHGSEAATTLDDAGDRVNRAWPTDRTPRGPASS